MQADLGRRLVFPTIIATNLRPDIILWSYECKKIIMVGLTKFHGKRERGGLQKANYQNFADDIHSSGFSAWVFLLDVGCRWFPVQSTCRAMTTLWITGKYGEKIEFRDYQYQLKNHHVGCGWEEQCRTWSYLQKGNYFADLPLRVRSRMGVETNDDGWTLQTRK